MLSALNVANAFIGISLYQKKPITPVRLQQLMYLTYREYLRNKKSAPFAERFVVANFGPALQSLTFIFADAKGNIKDLIRNAEGRYPHVTEEEKTLIAGTIVLVWNYCEHESLESVSESLKKKGSAWSIAKGSGCELLDDEDIIKEK